MRVNKINKNLKLEEIEREYRKIEHELPPDRRIDNVDISNDFMFCHIMQDKEIFKELVHRIMPNINIQRVEYCEYQKTLQENRETRGARFDVYANTDGGTKIFDIEMQNVDEDDLAKRARYYHSMMSSSIMARDKIKTYDDLPLEFVIFICKFDLFNQGRHIYRFKNFCCDDKNLPLNDGTMTIFLNAYGLQDDVSPGLKNFLNFIIGRTCSDPFIKKLEKMVEITRQSAEWRMNFMIMSMNERKTLRKGMAEGLKEGERIGIIKGERRGIIKGERRGARNEKFSTAQRLYSMGLPLNNICEATQLSMADLKSIIDINKD